MDALESSSYRRIVLIQHDSEIPRRLGAMRWDV